MQSAVVIKRHFPHLLEMLSRMPDSRERPQYKTEELLMAAISIFLFKRGSRNHADNTAKKGRYKANYERIFKCRLPDTDTSDELLRELPPEHLENLKRDIVRLLVRKKVFDKFRYKGLHQVAIDGTGLYSFNYEPYPRCPKKTSKNGKVTYTVFVLEAKLVCPNGFSISMATEWILNPEDGDYDKQDCELKAFLRLAEKIKKLYPRLPILMLADGLYPNNTGFGICKKYNWSFIFTFKDGNLKSVWEEVNLLRPITKDNDIQWADRNGDWEESHICTFFENIAYGKHTLHLAEAHITKTKKEAKTGELIVENERFVHITDIEINTDNCRQISTNGRLRWKIENEGFNTQKNGGYGLSHKFSRTSHTASCNYYQCLQVAHLINQLALLSKSFKEYFFKDAKESLKSLKEFGMAVLLVNKISNGKIDRLLESVGQLRY
jgi:hypothetical protein